MKRLKHEHCSVGFEVLTAVMKLTIWDIALCRLYEYLNQRFRGKNHLYFRGRKSAEQETSLLVVGYTEV
jgi:hypothetical protein